MLKTGINVPFLGIESNESNHDIGYNQFTGRQFWTDDWIDYDFTKPDPSYTEFNPYITWDSNNLANSFAPVIGYVNIIRFWVLEGCEGIIFKNSSIDNMNTVIDIDRTHLLPNIKKVLDHLYQNEIMVYLCLLNSWDSIISYNNYPDNPKKSAQHTVFTKTRAKNLKGIIQQPANFLSLVLTPLINHIKNHPAVYAIDIMNEPEGAMWIPEHQIVSFSEMKNFLIQCARTIHSLSPLIKVGCGTNNKDLLKYYTDRNHFPTGTFDLYDFHLYRNTTLEVDQDISYILPFVQYTKRILGEFGAFKEASIQQERNVIDRVLAKACEKGYQAVMPWALYWIKPENRQYVLNQLNFYRNKRCG